MIAPTDQFLTVTINPDVDGVRVALCGLGGRIVAQTFRPSNRVLTPSEATESVAAAIADLHAEVPASRLIALCAAIPGRVDRSGVEIVNAPHLRWRNVPFAGMLRDATGLPSQLVFDAVAGLAAEQHWGAARDTDDAVYLYGGPGGIGAAALVDGRILQGANGGVARLGHLLVAPDGPVCSCGNVGCLTTVVSSHILASAIGAPSVAPDQLHRALLKHPSAHRSAVLERQLDYVSTALRSIANIYDPDIVIMGGLFGLLMEFAGESLLQRLSDSTASVLRAPARLLAPALGENQLLIGASDTAFGPLLNDPIGVSAVDVLA
ncbi:hypothetical protein AKG07_09950 [Microbacterium sp. CGR1]|uniref:ROK family protein n=1 Tax=Microbacterium sp. CGR1 TaxID=1696072 RepID=UPI00069F4C2C|nr:ROK family protein [Microbacterium sp. CGR1]AKV86562.1 hypothetical protein AKG07_09950 [Microbacterium sp. CGR1]